MCIELWRRYFCPKAPSPTPTSDLDLGTEPHPQPRDDVADHHLVRECDNILRENQESPQDNVDEQRQIHWVYNLVRCAHLYSHQCVNSPCRGVRIQYFNRPCSFCTGGIDLHVRDFDEISSDVSVPLHTPYSRIPMDPELLQRFEEYREKYLLRLLLLFQVVLLKSLRPRAEGDTWKSFIQVAWPETFCRLDFDHIGHGAVVCECPGTKEEWRTNTAHSKRKNEALAILNSLKDRSGPHGAYVYFWWTEGYGIDQNWEPTERASEVYRCYNEEDFLPYQMPFVNFKPDDYNVRFAKLRDMAEGVLRQLKERGQDVSQQHPGTGYWMRCGIKWMRFDDWEKSLDRRMEFLIWAYQFLALDEGLHEHVMMYLGAALLAMLNPWPNPQVGDHPSHPNTCVLDRELAASDVLQECIWWVEFLWPLDGNSMVQDSYRQSIKASSEVNHVIQRNRNIELLDMKSRNRTSAFKTGLFAQPADVAIERGDETCPLCQEEWNHFPCHQPIELPCCKKFVGRRCMKQFLATKPIRPAGGNYLRREKWVEEFKCALCRERVGHHFSPHFYGHELGAPPKNIRNLSFYDDYEGFEKPQEYWQ